MENFWNFPLPGSVISGNTQLFPPLNFFEEQEVAVMQTQQGEGDPSNKIEDFFRNRLREDILAAAEQHKIFTMELMAANHQYYRDWMGGEVSHRESEIEHLQSLFTPSNFNQGLNQDLTDGIAQLRHEQGYYQSVFASHHSILNDLLTGLSLAMLS